ncbi:hypothetical protein [Burkholderia multivorans]|uniref:hypothetical protein n=1 Tax=Burkholderia multivorans TaxID=87883 RepID=UPI001C24B044|nr:hypothetical protein [Burkholderia multivorans]MBU9282816.1 hypothetical protein [Burkholderia multivorans]
MDMIAIMHDGADCCRERAAVMPYVGGSGGTDQDSIERRGRLAEGRSSVDGRSAARAPHAAASATTGGRACRCADESRQRQFAILSSRIARLYRTKGV